MKPRPPVPLDLSDAEKRALMEWVKPRYPHLFTPAALRRLVDQCLSHHAATGNRRGYTNWLAAVRNWIVKDQEIRDSRREARPELPFEHRETGKVIDLARVRVSRQ